MRMFVLIGVALAIQSGVAISADHRVCLRYRDLDGVSKVDTQTLIAKVKGGGGHYKIMVDDKCEYLNWPDNFFVTRNSSPWDCVHPGDALILNKGGNCFVQSVTPVAD